MDHTAHSLQITDLGCVRQAGLLFSPISIELNAHGVLFIHGENGVGKSSLLRLLAGLATPASGDIFWNKQSIRNLAQDYSKELHYVGHENGLKLGLTALENLTLAGFLQDDGNARTFDALSAFGLTEQAHTLAKHLSSGQKRRLALARLLLTPKPLWILDEPLTGLDQKSHENFLTQLTLHLTQGGMCIMTSHQTIAREFAHAQTVGLCAC